MVLRKNECFGKFYPRSQNLTELSHGSRSLRFCVCQPHTCICFSIKSLHFFVLGSDFKMPVSASWQVLDLRFATPYIYISAPPWIYIYIYIQGGALPNFWGRNTSWKNFKTYKSGRGSGQTPGVPSTSIYADDISI